jgi:hypothetical protein
MTRLRQRSSLPSTLGVLQNNWAPQSCRKRHRRAELSLAIAWITRRIPVRRAAGN